MVAAAVWCKFYTVSENLSLVEVNQAI